MKNIPFFKMNGSGNDFIIIDNRENLVEEVEIETFIRNICRRKFSAGADGVILVEASDNVDFKWRFYNSDASVAEMCGNGARCAARFAFLNGISGENLAFETMAGVIEARILGNRVKVKMTDPTDLEAGFSLMLDNQVYSVAGINTGVPHVVIQVDDIEAVKVKKLGRAIRYHDHFAPNGTNVNFVRIMDEHTLAIRTYERGVEDETFACGTGCVAAALLMAEKTGVSSPMELVTAGESRLKIYFEKSGSQFTDIYMEGDARVIYEGELWEESWSDL